MPATECSRATSRLSRGNAGDCPTLRVNWRGRNRNRGLRLNGHISARSDQLGWLAESAVKLELRGIVLVDRGRVLLEREVQCNQSGDVFLRANDYAEQFAGWPRCLAKTDEVFIGRLGRLYQTDLRLRHASPGSLESGQGLGDLGADAK